MIFINAYPSSSSSQQSVAMLSEYSAYPIIKTKILILQAKQKLLTLKNCYEN